MTDLLETFRARCLRKPSSSDKYVSNSEDWAEFKQRFNVEAMLNHEEPAESPCYLQKQTMGTSVS